jgi:hypothetical protein
MSENRFVGLWRLVSFRSTRSDGVSIDFYGPDPIGQIMYDAQGHMAVQIMRQDRPLFASSDWRGGTPEQIQAAFQGYIAYFGRYEVNEAEGYVIHRSEANLLPNFVGGELKRFYEFTGSRLTLKTPPQPVGGVSATSTIVWERVV